MVGSTFVSPRAQPRRVAPLDDMSYGAHDQAAWDAYYAQYGTGAAASYGTPKLDPAASTDSSVSLQAENTGLKAENATLRSENASLRAEVAALKAGGGAPMSAPHMVPPPQFYPPPAYPGYPPAYAGYPPAPYPSYAPPPPHAARPPPLAINADNKRGPKGANLAIFCIPNNFVDQQVYDLVSPYGNVVFCSVATHRDTGQSRGYAFVSYETVAEADNAKATLHDQVIEGRALRCELTRQDKDTSSKPY